LGQDFQAIPALSSAAGFWWAERLAAAVGKTPAWVRRVADQFGLDPAAAPGLLRWTAAVDLLGSWPERLYRFLDDFQQVPKNQTLNTGISRSFGSLLRDAAHLETLGYFAPAAALRTYLLEHYTAGHITRKVGLFRGCEHQALLRERPWCTQTEAAGVLQVRHGAVADLVRRGLLEGQLQPAGGRGRSIGVVSKRSLEALERSLGAGLDVPQTGQRLGISRSRVLELIRAGLLGPAVRTQQGWIIPREAVQALADVRQYLRPLGSSHHDWLSLRQATRVYGPSGLNLARALELVRGGRLAARTDGRYPDLRSLWLFQPDLAALLPALQAHRCQARGYSLAQLGKVLLPRHPCREPVLKKWIQAGLLRAHRQGRAWNVSPEEVERFRAEYCLADEACALLQISRATLSRWEASGRLRPVYAKRTFPGAGFSLFRRTDVQRDP
jgi:hypothetical protein